MDTKKDLDKITEIKEEKNTKIPDWLKGSLDISNDNEAVNKKKETKKDDIPDWLKGSLDETSMINEESEGKHSVKKENETQIKKVNKQDNIIEVSNKIERKNS